MNARFRQHPFGSSRAPKRNEVTAAGLASGDEAMYEGSRIHVRRSPQLWRPISKSVRSFHKRFSHSLSALQSQGGGGSWTFWLSCRTPLGVLLLPFLPAFGTYVAWPPYSSDCLVTSCWSLGEPEFCRGAVDAALSCRCLLLGCFVWRKFKLALALVSQANTWRDAAAAASSKQECDPVLVSKEQMEMVQCS